MNDFLYINHVNDYALDVGAEVFHPMVSVVHFDELGEIRHSLNKMGVYAISATWCAASRATVPRRLSSTSS